MSFSLVLFLSLACLAQFQELDSELATARTRSDARRTLMVYAPGNEIVEGLVDALDQGSLDLTELKKAVALQAEAERLVQVKPNERATLRARELKRSPLYRDPGPSSRSNWIARGFKRLGEWIKRLLDRATPDVNPQLPDAQASGKWIIWVAWILLAAGIVAFLAVVARRFSVRSLFKRRLRPLLEDDEPERTESEWLDQAALLEADGRFREAVRCLYLACLVRLDEARIARFIRSETNWEHLRRVESNPSTPEELGFREATSAFDRIWYGGRVHGQDDLRAFREHYTRVADCLDNRGAAA